jgi:hypothetical protein
MAQGFKLKENLLLFWLLRGEDVPLREYCAYFECICKIIFKAPQEHRPSLLYFYEISKPVYLC